MDIRRKQRAVVDALEDVKGHDIVVFNVAKLSPFFERVVIASGDSSRQVKALADHVEDKMRALGERVHGVEGQAGGEWVLVDLGDIVVHVMHPAVRSHYNLEELWGGKPVKFAAPRKAARGKARPRRARR
jgi:ribosome-associated protein